MALDVKVQVSVPKTISVVADNIIYTGIDLSSTTANNYDVLEGKTFYSGQTFMKEGTIQKEQVEVKSTEEEFVVIPSGHNLIDEVTINPMVLEELEVTPTEEEQIIIPGVGVDGYKKIITNPIPSSYHDTTDATALAEHIVAGKTAYINGGAVEGSFNILHNQKWLLESFASESHEEWGDLILPTCYETLRPYAFASTKFDDLIIPEGYNTKLYGYEFYGARFDKILYCSNACDELSSNNSFLNAGTVGGTDFIIRNNVHHLPSFMGRADNGSSHSLLERIYFERDHIVTSLPQNAFYNAHSVRYVKIPDTVVDLEGSLFGFHKVLCAIEFTGAQVPTMETWAFSDVANTNIIVIVPDQYYTSYKNIITSRCGFSATRIRKHSDRYDINPNLPEELFQLNSMYADT